MAINSEFLNAPGPDAAKRSRGRSLAGRSLILMPWLMPAVVLAGKPGGRQE
jgi:hypothetical protein